MKIMSTVIAMIAATAALHAQGVPAGAMAQIKIVRANNFGFISEQLVGGTPVKGEPYSAQAVTETVQTLGDGNRIVQKTTAMLYRDALGRERREETIPAIGPFTSQGNPPQIISISDPVAGVNYSLNSNEHTARKVPVVPPVSVAGAGGKFNVTGPAVFVAGQSEKVPANVEQLGLKVIEGVQAEGTRTTVTIPAGQIGNDRPIDIVDELWKSPDLQVIVLSKHSDPRFGETSYSLTNISRADPPEALFQVPPDYTVRDGGFSEQIEIIKRKLP
jgi:hypothetical protein